MTLVKSHNSNFSQWQWLELVQEFVLKLYNFLHKFGLCFLNLILFHENCVKHCYWISTYIFLFNFNTDFQSILYHYKCKLLKKDIKNIICCFLIKKNLIFYLIKTLIKHDKAYLLKLKIIIFQKIKHKNVCPIDE